MLRRVERITAALSEEYRQEDQAHGKPFHPVDLPALCENLGYVALKNGDFDESAAALEKGLRLALVPNMFINLATALAGKNDPHDAEVTMIEGMIRRHDGPIATKLIKLFGVTEPNTCALVRTGNSFRLNTSSRWCKASYARLRRGSFRCSKRNVRRWTRRASAPGQMHAGCKL